jgi:hypothetical protein
MRLEDLPDDTRVVVLPKKNGEPSNTAVIVDDRAGDLKGASLVRGEGAEMDCDPVSYDFIINGKKCKPRWPCFETVLGKRPKPKLKP